MNWKQLIHLFIIHVLVYLFSTKVNQRNVCRILVIRLDEIGDVVLTSPFLRELRRNYPKADITLVVKPGVYNLVECCPYVNCIKTFNSAKGKGVFFKSIIEAHRFVVHNLSGGYDLAIVPRFDADAGYGAGWLAFFSGAIRRIGYSSLASKYKSIVDFGFDNLYTDIVPIRDGKVHEVERNMDILRYLGCTVMDVSLELWSSGADDFQAKKILLNSCKEFNNRR